MMTAAGTMDITDEQIRALRMEAMHAGDFRQVDVCDRALIADRDVGDYDQAIGGLGLTRDQARAECARVVASARAQS